MKMLINIQSILCPYNVVNRNELRRIKMVNYYNISKILEEISQLRCNKTWTCKYIPMYMVVTYKHSNK